MSLKANQSLAVTARLNVLLRLVREFARSQVSPVALTISPDPSLTPLTSLPPGLLLSSEYQLNLLSHFFCNIKLEIKYHLVLLKSVMMGSLAQLSTALKLTRNHERWTIIIEIKILISVFSRNIKFPSFILYCVGCDGPHNVNWVTGSRRRVLTLDKTSQPSAYTSKWVRIPPPTPPFSYTCDMYRTFNSGTKSNVIFLQAQNNWLDLNIVETPDRIKLLNSYLSVRWLGERSYN